MTVDQLDKKENSLLLQINSIVGSIEERARQLKAKGIFNAYKQVHSQYADLAQENSEALKRGLFLQWYAFIEPAFLSGVCDIDPRAEQRIINILNDRIGQNKVDPELYFMTSYYTSWEFIFDRFQNCDNIIGLISSRADYNQIIEQIKGSNLDCRGQMGIYWQTIISTG